MQVGVVIAIINYELPKYNVCLVNKGFISCHQ